MDVMSGVYVMCREADLITITDKADLQHALNDAMEAAERSASLPGHGTRGLPLQSLLAGHPVKLQLVRCKEVRCIAPQPGLSPYSQLDMCGHLDMVSSQGGCGIGGRGNGEAQAANRGALLITVSTPTVYSGRQSC